MKKIYILLENILMHPTESRCRALHVTLESLLRVISISLASPHPAEGALVCRSRKKNPPPRRENHKQQIRFRSGGKTGYYQIGAG